MDITFILLALAFFALTVWLIRFNEKMRDWGSV